MIGELLPKLKLIKINRCDPRLLCTNNFHYRLQSKPSLFTIPETDYICPVKDWNLKEVELLYGSLVQLKDKAQPKPSSETEPAAKKKSPKKMILTSPSLLVKLHASDSSFIKICEALSIPHSGLLLDLDSFNSMDTSSTKVIWTLGLSNAERQIIDELEVPQVLHSEDPEALERTEDKRKLYEPLKEFAVFLRD